MAQDSPPISPHLYQSGAYSSQVLAPSSTILAAQQYTNLVQQHQQQQQQQIKPLPTSAVPEIWVPKTDYTASVAASGHTLAYDVTSTPVGYYHPSMKMTPVMTQQQEQQQSAFPMPKVEQASSPAANLQMDIQP